MQAFFYVWKAAKLAWLYLWIITHSNFYQDLKFVHICWHIIPYCGHHLFQHNRTVKGCLHLFIHNMTTVFKKTYTPEHSAVDPQSQSWFQGSVHLGGFLRAPGTCLSYHQWWEICTRSWFKPTLKYCAKTEYDSNTCVCCLFYTRIVSDDIISLNFLLSFSASFQLKGYDVIPVIPRPLQTLLLWRSFFLQD